MKLIYLEKPFSHFLIENFYTDKEIDFIKYELTNLSEVLQEPKFTGTAKEPDGTLKKSNLGIFISDAYKNNAISPIFNARKKLFDPVVMQEILSRDSVFSYLPHTNHDNTLVQFYKNNDYYRPHSDSALYSFITVFLLGQKKYTGGKLKFVEYNYEIDLQHNNSIMFPSYLKHEVTSLSTDSDNLLDSRISITTFIGLVPIAFK